MNPQPQETSPAEELAPIRTLYHQLLDSWNQRNAADFAALFHPDSNLIGFDGSQVNGRAAIESHLSQIFADHLTATYVGLVREVRFLTPEVALLRAVAGLVPPGKSDLNPATNAVQTLITVRHNNTWHIALYQNTPAQFHGRPDLAQQLTQELRKLLP
jgi:uncharacterized protein (TIGR02246 family)